ncbi:MAG: hypothetical protein V3R76_08815 [Gammaproteobacteria bacterium]
MPRIKPVNRNQLDPETRSLLKTKSGGDEARWNVEVAWVTSPDR